MFLVYTTQNFENVLPYLIYPLIISRESFQWKTNKSVACFQKSSRAGSFNRWIQIKYFGGTKKSTKWVFQLKK